MSEPNYRDIMLQLIASLTMCDHMGDVADDVREALKRSGVNVEWDEWRDLGRWCASQGITTLYGTTLGDDDEADE